MTSGEDARYGDALAALSQGRPAEARTVLTALVDDQPDHAGAWASLGRACMIMGDWAGALATLAEARVLSPGDIDVAMNLARCHWRNGSPEDALAVLATLPPGGEAVRLAADILPDIPPLSPGSVPGTTLALMKSAARLLADRGDWAKAATSFARVTDASPDDAIAQCDRMAAEISASSLLSLDVPALGLPDLLRLRQAIDAFRRARAIDPAIAQLWRNLGMMLAKLDERTSQRISVTLAAAHCMVRWLALRPDEPAARAAVADIFYARRQLPEAASVHFGRLIPSGPGWEEQAVDEFLDRVDGSLATIETLLSSPPSLDGVVEIGTILATLGLSREAAAIYRHAHQAAPERTEIRNALADMLVRHRLLVDAAAIYSGRPACPQPRLVGTI